MKYLYTLLVYHLAAGTPPCGAVIYPDFTVWEQHRCTETNYEDRRVAGISGFIILWDYHPLGGTSLTKMP